MGYYVYILANSGCTVLYVGVTRDLLARVRQHKEARVDGFTKRYRVNRLVYYEEYTSAYDAITREKQLKAGSRRKKMELVDGFNPTWRDLYTRGSEEPREIALLRSQRPVQEFTMRASRQGLRLARD